MKKIIFPITLFGLLSLASCSNTSTDSEVSELTDSTNADFVVDSGSESLENISEEAPLADNLDAQLEGEAAPVEEAQPVEEVAATEVLTNVGGEAEYTVEKNDTLMLIAFKIYGDYGKWKEIRDLNPQVNSKALTEGQVLKYNAPAEKFIWNPQGNPYLIQKGQTLGLISGEVYGQQKRWREIYDNNRPMIKDPNLIFAGFTLYYIPDRDVASENY